MISGVIDGSRAFATKFELDERPADKRIGLVLLATDHTTERDFARIVPRDEVAVYCNRIVFENPTSADNLRAMEPRLSEGAALILPGEPLDAICYACTAASAILGDDDVAAALAKGKPGVPAVTPPLAAVKALTALGAKRISILTPYVEEVAAPVVEYFGGHGFAVDQVTNFGIDDDRTIASVATRSIVEAASGAVDQASDALFISCTALRSAEVAAAIEALCGRPVVTSNQASAWMSLRLAGVDRPVTGYGRVLTLPLPG